jgi:hypothetical protein
VAEEIPVTAPAEASAKATLNKIAAPPTTQTKSNPASGMQEVKEPSLSEEMGDEVKF